MHWIDWTILVLPLLVILVIGMKTRRHVKSVSDFMTGGRVAGRYLVSVSDGMAGLGLITVVGFFEFFYKSGFALGHWQTLGLPITLLLTLTGFIVYRYRETRCMTLAQFFELRYSKRFRVFCGFVAACSGILNYGIFPAVGGRFIVYYAGLPQQLSIGPAHVDTFLIVMVISMAVALWLVLFGGQLTNMVTECVQGIINYGLYLVVIGAVLTIFNWKQMSSAMLARPAGESMLNPFDTGNLSDFNIWFVLIGLFFSVYGMYAWQGNAGFACAAASPHEQKMGRILGTWRGGASQVMIILLAAAAYTYMHHADFAAGRAAVDAELATIPSDAIRTQMTVPLAIRNFLPVGVAGAFLTIMIFLMVTTDTTYLHSWGSMVVQDVILPLRRRPFTPEQHLRWLRVSIACVGMFAVVFSYLFAQTTYIFMYFAITGAIFTGGAGAVIIGGLYWKRATAVGAWTAMVVGGTFAVSAILLEQFWTTLNPTIAKLLPFTASYIHAHAEKFPFNGQVMLFYSMMAAILSSVTVSLLTCRTPFDMDRMLHRGKYARPEDRVAIQEFNIPLWRKLVGIDEQFTRGDKAIAWAVFGYSMLVFAIWLGVTLTHLVHPLGGEGWARYFWIMGVCWATGVGVITAVWFGIGGTRDVLRMFRKLETLKRDDRDDGRVIGHANADDVEARAVPSASNKPIAEPVLSTPEVSR
ncbi:MAG: hypothetical protein QM770_01690 [Tepidisphaeraceae bacterium]